MEGGESMSSREEIQQRLRKNTRETYEQPDLSQLKPITYADPVAEFIKNTTTIAGARLIEMQEGDDLESVVSQAYPDAQGSVGVIHGDIGVAENACVWIPQTMEDRSVCFASEQLVIVLSRQAIVQTYFKEYKFGTFISGPSKTADIEGALVYGAQAARAVTVVLK